MDNITLRNKYHSIALAILQILLRIDKNENGINRERERGIYKAKLMTSVFIVITFHSTALVKNKKCYGNNKM